MARQALATPFAMPPDPSEDEVLARYFRVLSDPLRLRVLDALVAHGEHSVSALAARLEEPQPKVSNHLACLRWCGFVERERRHPQVFYRVADERVGELLALGRGLLADHADRVASCERVAAP